MKVPNSDAPAADSGYVSKYANYEKLMSQKAFTTALMAEPRHCCSYLYARRKLLAVSSVLVAIAFVNCWWFLRPLSLTAIFSNPTPDQLYHVGGQQPPIRVDLPQIHETSNQTSTDQGQSCDLSIGKWIRTTRPPLYTNETCKYIHPSQDCLKNGRPDRDYLYWKWQPLRCDVPDFDAIEFLNLVVGKKMAFVGDSIARNHMQSLLCSLAQVEDPQNLYYDVKEKEATWFFRSYNFTLANIWSPFLVNHTVEKDIYKLHLDMPDIVWTVPLASYDIALISTGYWYFRPSIYYLHNKTLGTNPRSGLNLTTFEILPAMKITWETVLKYMVEEFRGLTIARTITVPHFESGSWSNGGACNKTQPLFDPDFKEPFPWMSYAINKLQLEVFSKATKQFHSKDRASNFKIMNVTYSSFLRQDGHPSSYRIQKPGEPRNDCLHWCLPGPIDMWNQLILHNLKS